MIAIVALIGAADAGNSVPAIVGGLAGCWKVTGEVRGKDATSIARGEWHLGRRYLVLHLRAVAQKEPYEAALVYGAGDTPQSINGYWMDTFGGAYSTPGAGIATNDGFRIEYRYPDSTYANRFTRVGKGWRWTIAEQSVGKPDRLFAEYNFAPATCRGMSFGF
jgi:hypothetical protein